MGGEVGGEGGEMKREKRRCKKRDEGEEGCSSSSFRTSVFSPLSLFSLYICSPVCSPIV